MRRYAFFPCCGMKVPGMDQCHEPAVRAILKKIGIATVDSLKFNCCGYPLKAVKYEAFILASVRNLALAEKAGVSILTSCSCCYGSLKEAREYIKNCSDGQREEILAILKKEGLGFTGKADIFHLVEVLVACQNELSAKVTRRLNGVRIAIHPGCHFLRPWKEFGFESPSDPFRMMAELMGVIGAEAVRWTGMEDCCGGPQLGSDADLAVKLLSTKVKKAGDSGAELICIGGCPCCHFMFDGGQEYASVKGHYRGTLIPAVLVQQLIGWALGLSEEELGLRKNVILPEILLR